MALSPENPHSYARPELTVVTHTRLELFVDFKHNVLRGKAIITVNKNTMCDEVVLDTYVLKISSVTELNTETKFVYEIGHHCNKFGSKFTIKLPIFNKDGTKRMNNIYKIQIEYETSPNSPALYWLKPDQTSDGTHPLLISNSKFTYARAIFPCQDIPSHEISFVSEISVPKLGFNVIMAGHRKEVFDMGNELKYRFTPMANIIPYAISIIVGSLEKKKIRRHNTVYNLWTEKKYIQQSEMALNKITDMLFLVEEKLYGSLGQLNVCVLPPNMPEFDMQCPLMTLVSSNLLSGDFSMINTIVQNILESWMGRLVAIANFQHLWLIKSLSTFIYRDFIKYFNIEMQEFLEKKGMNNLINMVNLHDVPLVPNLTGDLPKDVIKNVPYEKGYLLLDHLQRILGGPGIFKEFLQYYLKSCESVVQTTDHFKKCLYSYFSGEIKVLNSVHWNRWFYERGIPFPHSIKEIDCHLEAERWIAEQASEKWFLLVPHLRSHSDLIKIEFLTYLLASPTVLRPFQKLEILERAFQDNENCEIRFLWLRLCIKSKWLKVQMPALKFACEYCMPKYACPIFRDMYEWTITRFLTISWFMDDKRRSKMLPETIKELKSILKVKLDDEI
ncbi:leukotriene A-4 hydrolase-like [Temnothorax nylanderi]|uniref:leukotriene A-4 hydrolase-like n=1 Tax=Temnothorax nylanderi TaxID=102681 RepID=UPI003A8C3568